MVKQPSCEDATKSSQDSRKKKKKATVLIKPRPDLLKKSNLGSHVIVICCTIGLVSTSREMCMRIYCRTSTSSEYLNPVFKPLMS